MLNGLMALALMAPAATPASQEPPTEPAPSTASAPAPDPPEFLDTIRPNVVGKLFWYTRAQATVHQADADPKNPDFKYAHTRIPKFSAVRITSIAYEKSNWRASLHVNFETLSGVKGEESEALFPLGSAYYGPRKNAPSESAPTFESLFLNSDPRQAHRWSKRVWQAIEQEKAFIGMSAEQAKLSWGSSHSINRTTTSHRTEEQWVYGHSYLYVSNGVVTAIQN